MFPWYYMNSDHYTNVLSTENISHILTKTVYLTLHL